ncbi:MAG: VWA domain-containing protein [Bdellovibrionota bacterium]
MKFNFKSIIVVAVIVLAAACTNESSKMSPDLPLPKIGDKVSNLSNPKVDILFVIDNSGSMSTHQSNLAANIDVFVDEIKNFGYLDYRIGVTTSTFYNHENSTPGYNGNLIGSPNYVDRQTRDGEEILKSRLKVGTSSPTNEIFLETVKEALSPASMAGTNAGFYRQEAYLAIIFITDAEDQGEVLAYDLHDYLVTLKNGMKSRVLSYGAIIPTNSSTNCPRDDDSTPVQLEKFIELTGGSYFDLCDPSYGAKLADMAKDLARRVAGAIALSRRPKPSTIEVNYGTQIIPQSVTHGWVYAPATNAIIFGPQLVFDEEQPEGTRVEVKFEPVPIED